MKKNMFIKNIIIIFGLNALIYFLIKLFINDYNLIGSKIDDLIPFNMYFIYIYTLWYPIEIINLYFIYKNNINIYKKTITTLFVAIIISDIILILYPTTVNRPIIANYNSITSFMTYIVFMCDTPVNCLPSLHSLICSIMILANINIKYKFKYIFIILNILIIISTLLTKQHVIYDVILAMMIANITYFLLSKLNIFNKLKERLTN